jgi:hypothetical protein
MKRLIKLFIDKTPYLKSLHQQIKKQGIFPAGHYYSPIPDSDEILSYTKSITPPAKNLLDVKLNRKSQLGLLEEFYQFYEDLPFPEKQKTDCRYYYDNIWYSYSDAIFLYCFLRQHKPKRIIEIGSGFSSAAILDTVDSMVSYSPEITFIEPYPDRLFSLLRRDDKDRIKIVDKKLQEVSAQIFFKLAPGDLLFIDSSHVVKCGSDLELLLFDILPHLPGGIFIHFHDVFYPFNYPSEWLKRGIYWNEGYFLRAFLSYNSEWCIYFFNSYAAFAFNDFIAENMPMCLKNSGGSLYIKRRNTT